MPKKDYTIDIGRLLENLKAELEGVRTIGPIAFGYDRDNFILKVEQLKANLPRDIREAESIARESEKLLERSRIESETTIKDAEEDADRILREANEQAARILEEARLQQQNMVNESEVTRLVKETTDETKRNAERDARDVMRQADDYALRVLRSLEGSVTKVLTNIEAGKASLERVQEGDDAPEEPRERTRAGH